MDAVADGDQIESACWLFCRKSGSRLRSRLCLRNRRGIDVVTHDLAVRKSLRESDADLARAAAVVEHAAAGLKLRHHFGQRLEPVVGEAVFVLAAIDEIERVNAIRAEVAEGHAAPGADCVHALDLINRGQYEYRFTDYWLKALPEVVAKLEAGGRVLDYGCGSGQVCIALAKGFPNSEVVGYDVDAASIAKAKAASQSRTAFTTEKPTGTFDLITICDCIHDLAAPVETLQQIKTLLKDDAVLFIIEPKAADRLEDNRNPVATMFYGFSIFHCMTQSLARGGPGLRTCLAAPGTERLLREAGFSRFRALHLKSQTNLFYAPGH